MKLNTLWITLLLCYMAVTDSVCCAEQSATYYTQDEIKTIGLSIARSLRCPMSTNQNLLDSQAPIASELKAEIFLQLEQGRSETQIIDFMVQRYGEKIRYMPAISQGAIVLYLFPLVLVVLIVAWGLWHRRNSSEIRQQQ